ncbi:MAG: ABC transporter substrate-binding protein [Actinomycetota bacterium]
MKNKSGIFIAIASITASLISAITLAAPSQAASCKAGALTTLTKGVLTIGTDDPAYSPWFDNNTPSNGKGFESAVAYAVAKQLGYPTAKVKWVKAPFNSVIQPGKKSFDFDINEVSITKERAKAVDFSSGYYDVAQAIVTVTGSKIEKAKSIKALSSAKLGAAVGTTSYTTITDVIKPKTKPAVFDTNDVATQALTNGQIDGLVLDLPTAFYVAYAQLKNGAIVGQLPAKKGSEQFGLVLSKGSPLTSCVTKAVDALRTKGSLTAIATKWLSSSAGVPVLK